MRLLLREPVCLLSDVGAAKTGSRGCKDLHLSGPHLRERLDPAGSVLHPDGRRSDCQTGSLQAGGAGGTERGRTEERGLGGETQSRRTAGLPVRRLQALFVVHRQGVGSIDPFLVIEGVPGRVFGLPGEIFRGLGDGQHSASV